MPALAIWSPDDGVLGAVAPLALAAAAGTALVVDLDPGGPRYPGEATLGALVAADGMSEEGAGLLASAVTERRNLLITGGTGSGETTLLNVLSKEIDPADRTVTVEDAAELKLSGHVVRLEARPPNAEGAGEVTLRTLLRHALRLRPDRIIIGEVRGPEALDMIQAMTALGPSSSKTAELMTQVGRSPVHAGWSTAACRGAFVMCGVFRTAGVSLRQSRTDAGQRVDVSA